MQRRERRVESREQLSPACLFPAPMVPITLVGVGRPPLRERRAMSVERALLSFFLTAPGDYVRRCQRRSDYVRRGRTMSDGVGLCRTVSDEVGLCRTMSDGVGQNGSVIKRVSVEGECRGGV